MWLVCSQYVVGKGGRDVVGICRYVVGMRSVCGRMYYRLSCWLFVCSFASTVHHLCHSEETCPPCTVLTKKMCMGEHEVSLAGKDSPQEDTSATLLLSSPRVDGIFASTTRPHATVYCVIADSFPSPPLPSDATEHPVPFDWRVVW